MTVTAWQTAEADSLETKAESLDVTIERLEADAVFLERDLNGHMPLLRKTLGILRTKRDDYRSDAERLRNA
jgi:hypothetical protein